MICVLFFYAEQVGHNNNLLTDFNKCFIVVGNASIMNGFTAMHGREKSWH